jgi:hypothetical protein
VASSVFLDLTNSGSAPSSIIPTQDNTFDLGSSSFQWRSAYIGTSIVMANAATLSWTDAAVLRSTTKTLALSAGGSNRVTVSDVAVTSTLPYYAPVSGYRFATDVSDDTAMVLAAENIIDFNAGGGAVFRVDGAGSQIVLRSGNTFSFAGSGIGSSDLFMERVSSGLVRWQNATAPTGQRQYGYLSGSRAAYGQVQTAINTATLSGATTTCSNLIPAGAFVIGVATTTTTTITGASGYQVGDGSDADRWGDITGTAVGTVSTNASATANPTGWFSATNNVVLTAKTSNFTGGVVQVVVFYFSTSAS